LSSTTANAFDRSRGGLSPHRLLCSLVVAIAAGLLAAGVLHGAPPPPGPFVVGDGKAFLFEFEFGAVRSRLTGEVSGRATFSWIRRPRGTVQIQVTCVQVEGRTAAVGGKIVRRTGRRVPKRFRGAVFFVEDNQRSGQTDRISRLQLRTHAPAACPEPGSAAAGLIRNGDIAVSSGPL